MIKEILQFTTYFQIARSCRRTAPLQPRDEDTAYLTAASHSFRVCIHRDQRAVVLNPVKSRAAAGGEGVELSVGTIHITKP
jgi:hypothetical protein